MYRFRIAAGALVAVLTGLTAGAEAAPLYTLLDLGSLNPALPATGSRAYDINELGQVVGETSNVNGRPEGFRTAPNVAINPATDGLGNLGGRNPSSTALAINDQGQVVGQVQDPGNNGFRAFVTAPNQRIVSHMGTLMGGPSSSASAVNNVGHVVGYSFIAPDPTDPSLEALAFRTSGSGPLTDSDSLGTLATAPPRRGSGASDINDRGQVVGTSGNNAARREAFRTAPNAPINPATDGLGTLGGDSFGTAINSGGQAVGYSDLVGSGTPALRVHAFRTGPDAAINPLTDDLGTLGGARSRATDINDFGVVVGSSNRVPDPNPPEFFAPLHAFVYIDGEGMLDLNDLVADGLPAGWTLEQAEGINNKGQIVGYANVLLAEGGTTTRAFLLTPVPEPRLGALPLAMSILLAVRPVRRVSQRAHAVWQMGAGRR